MSTPEPQKAAATARVHPTSSSSGERYLTGPGTAPPVRRPSLLPARRNSVRDPEAVQRASAATKIQAISRGCNSRAKVDIPTVGKRLARLQADRQGFASLGKAMVLAAATAAVVFLQSDVGGAHAVESALQRKSTKLSHNKQAWPTVS